ncbi:hypothetical protein CF326_g5227 [Tilletia indica]|nr:hypothetical protein CF326_g5227 [Tilletia indica]
MKRGDNANGTYLSYPFNYPAAPQTKGQRLCGSDRRSRRIVLRSRCTRPAVPDQKNTSFIVDNSVAGGWPNGGSGIGTSIVGGGGGSTESISHRLGKRLVVAGGGGGNRYSYFEPDTLNERFYGQPATEGKSTTTWKGGDASPDLKYVTGGGGGGLLGGVAGEAGNGGYAGKSLGDIMEERGGNNEQAGSAVIKFTCFSALDHRDGKAPTTCPDYHLPFHQVLSKNHRQHCILVNTGPTRGATLTINSLKLVLTPSLVANLLG